jgi:hypothetical protein
MSTTHAIWFEDGPGAAAAASFARRFRAALTQIDGGNLRGALSVLSSWTREIAGNAVPGSVLMRLVERVTATRVALMEGHAEEARGALSQALLLLQVE